MGVLRKLDFGIVPLYLIKCRKAPEQTVILWLHAHALSGEPWTYKLLAEEAGVSSGVASSVCKKLVEEGLLSETEAAETARPSSKFSVNSDAVPEREPEQEPEKKEKEKLPMWAIEASAVWRKYQGELGPRQMHNFLKHAVQMNGHERVLVGLERYARKSDKQYSPSPFKFVQNIKGYMPSAASETRGGGRSMADLLNESKGGLT